MKHHRSHKRAAFTLIELLTVIAIIGILAAIIIPTVGNVSRRAQKTADLSNMKQILTAATIYAGENNGKFPQASNRSLSGVGATVCTPFEWAGLIAKSGGINDPAFYISKLEKTSPAVAPGSILNTTKDGVEPVFTAAVDLSIEMVVGVKQTMASTTPLIFTRGLTTAGVWDTTNGVYGEDADGVIGFIGGNVASYKALSDETGAGVLTNTNNTKTANILQALPSGVGAPAVLGTPKSSLKGSAGAGT